MKFFHVPSTTKEIPLSLVLRIIHVEFGGTRTLTKCDQSVVIFITINTKSPNKNIKHLKSRRRPAFTRQQGSHQMTLSLKH